jgi:hypothetical protein
MAREGMKSYNLCYKISPNWPKRIPKEILSDKRFAPFSIEEARALFQLFKDDFVISYNGTLKYSPEFAALA